MMFYLRNEKLVSSHTPSISKTFSKCSFLVVIMIRLPEPNHLFSQANGFSLFMWSKLSRTTKTLLWRSLLPIILSQLSILSISNIFLNNSSESTHFEAEPIHLVAFPFLQCLRGSNCLENSGDLVINCFSNGSFPNATHLTNSFLQTSKSSSLNKECTCSTWEYIPTG